MTTGANAWPSISPEGRIATAPALGQADFGEGPLRPMMVIGDDSGLVRAYRADNGELQWRTQLPGSGIRSSPVVVDGVVYVATTSGFIHTVDLTGEGDVLQTFPVEGNGLGRITADLAYSDGFLYVGTEEGFIHVLDISSGESVEVCNRDLGFSVTVPPIVVGDIVYVPTLGQQVWTFPSGQCDGSVPDRSFNYFAEAAMDVAPAVDGDVIYLPAGRFLNPLKLSLQAVAESSDPNDNFLWPPADVTGQIKITAAPVIAGDTVYFGDEEGIVYAVDAVTGEERWRWNTAVSYTHLTLPTIYSV